MKGKRVETPRVYISGPMRDIEDFNYPAFHEAEETLALLGFRPLNPARSFGGDQSRPFESYMRADIELILGATHLVLLPGWEHSHGATIERQVAACIGVPIHLYDPAMGLGERKYVTFNFQYATTESGDHLAFSVPEGATLRGAAPEPITTWAEAETGLLDAAKKIVQGDRQRTYGHPAQHHARTASLWSSYLGAEVRPQDVSICMILDKVSRMRGKNKPDNAVDLAGYAAVHGMVMAAVERGEA